MTGSANPASEELVAGLLEVAGDQVLSVVLFGSQLVDASPDRFSAHDFVVVVRSYHGFHRRLVAGGHHRRRAWLLDALARVLPPNVMAVVPRPDGPVAKCMIFDEADFSRALSPSAPDHFLKGRMAHRVAVLYGADAGVEGRVGQALERARDDALRWAGPFVDEPFDAESFALGMLEISYGGEIRPESGDRVREVFEAQRPALVALYEAVLDRAAGARVLIRDAAGYRFVDPPGPGARLRVRLYFMTSKLRATLRWLKHIATFNDWLTYIQRKVERRTGMTVEITPLERKYPLVFLWPKVVRVLRARPPANDGGP